MRRATPCEQMGPVDMNGGIHTARKQHQRKNVPICLRVASRVLCGLVLMYENDKMINEDKDENEALHSGPLSVSAHKTYKQLKTLDRIAANFASIPS